MANGYVGQRDKRINMVAERARKPKELFPELDQCTVKAIVERITDSNSAITYGDLAKVVGKMRGKTMSSQGFSGSLGRIQGYCKELGLPSLSAMVVDQSMKPKEGFAKYYKSIHPESAEMSEMEIVKEEQRACLACDDWQLLYDRVGLNETAPAMRNIIEEADGKKIYEEGKRITKDFAQEVARNSQARIDCLALKGHRCIVCEQDLEEKYGVPGIIHVHHLKPLYESLGDREVDPVKDLVPVCPNCHAVIHSKGPRECYTFNEVREMLGLDPLEHC